MRNFFSGRRRYALACLVAVGALITAAASCEPVKAPVKPPPPTGLSISPTSHDFGVSNPQTFTVTNNGSSTSGTLHTELTGTNATDFVLGAPGPENTCEGEALAAGKTCVVDVSFNPSDANPKEANLVVNSDQPADGEAVAKLTGKQI